MKIKSLVFILDRDGVINQDSDHYIKCPEEWYPIGGSIEAIRLLKKRGHKVVIASNQSGIGRGYLSLWTLAEIHNQLHKTLAESGTYIDGIFFCPHTPETECNCRKPKTGLLDYIKDSFAYPIHNMYFIGDSQRDIESGKASGIQPILVKSGNGKETEKEQLEGEKIPVYNDLLHAVNALTGQDV